MLFPKQPHDWTTHVDHMMHEWKQNRKSITHRYCRLHFVIML